MKVGIVSDTHGRDDLLRAAIEKLKNNGAEVLVHCGDVGSHECVEILGQSGMKIYMVAGNSDKFHPMLKSAADAWNINFHPVCLEFSVNGHTLAVTHGNDDEIIASLKSCDKVKYLCHGHTHKIRDEVSGNCRMINPGAIHNPRDPGYPTVAMLDTASEKVHFLEIEEF